MLNGTFWAIFKHCAKLQNFTKIERKKFQKIGKIFEKIFFIFFIFLLSFLKINIKFKTCVGKTLDWTWIRPILFRNTIVTLVTCGFWDWFLYFSPLKDKLHKYKVTFSFSKSLKLPFLWCL